MNRDFEFFHGVVFTKILHGTQRPVSARLFQSASNASYVINDTIGIYIKYSKKRMPPWRFAFKKEHQAEIDSMKFNFTHVFLILVCNDDGVVCLSYSELKELLDSQHDAVEWMSATRHKREMYSVKGSNGELEFKIGQNDFPEKIFQGS